MELSEKLHTISDKFFFWKSVGSMRDTFDIGGSFQISVLKDVLSMRLGQSVSGTIREFIKDPRVAQMLDHYVQYVGSSPDNSPAILCSIGHMQAEQGIWYPKGGTRAVPQALVRLGSELGVRYHTSIEIARLLTRAALFPALKQAAGKSICSTPWFRMKTRCAPIASCLAARLPIASTNAESTSRRVPAWCFTSGSTSATSIWRTMTLFFPAIRMRSFTTSTIWPSRRLIRPAISPPLPPPIATTAPAGGDALYVLVHTPFLRPKHDWSKMFPAYRQVILNKLKRTAGLADIEERIVFERALTPLDIHERYRVLNGAIYGISSHGRWNGAFKPANASPDLEGVPGGRGGASRTGNADGDDERLDRRRRARPALSRSRRRRFRAAAG